MYPLVSNLTHFLHSCTRTHLKATMRQLDIKRSLCILHTLTFLKVKRAFGLTQYQRKHSGTKEENVDDALMDAVLADAEHKEFVERVFRVLPMGHQVFVIQPRIKWGPRKKRNTTPQLQLQETEALVETLSGWRVVDRVIMPVKTYDSKYLFGSGNLETLKEKVRNNTFISSVLINVNILRAHQIRALKEELRLPVFDRYSIVLQIFREHAKTREARLQIALAEIPYLRVKIGEAVGGTGRDRGGGGAAAIGGEGEKWIKVKMDQLEEREKTIKRSLLKLETHRKILKKQREHMQIPTVAVVGYTNSGKTSLIKALTGDNKLTPKDQLFATLDVTTHAGVLPCRQTALFIDTVGFVADIPTTLIEAFRATLSDAIDADVVIHVFDVSHPDIVAQCDVVNSTLMGMLPESKLPAVITVANKVDLVKNSDEILQKIQLEDSFVVSCTEKIGIGALMEEIEAAVIKTTNRQTVVIRVPAGGQESRWLYRHGVVKDASSDPMNAQYMLLQVILTPVLLAKFKHAFPSISLQPLE